MNLYNLLNSGSIFEGELDTVEWDAPPCSFIWENMKVTAAGKEHFKKLMLSEARIVGSNIELLDKDITEDELAEFVWAVAGYCSQSNYDKWFGVRP